MRQFSAEDVELKRLVLQRTSLALWAVCGLALAGLCVSTRARAASIDLGLDWVVVQSVDAFQPPDSFAGSIHYDTDAGTIVYTITQIVDSGAPWFDFFFANSGYGALALGGSFSQQLFATDGTTYYSRSGVYTLGPGEAAQLLAGEWYVVANSYYSTFATQLFPVPEPAEATLLAVALGLLLALAPGLAARAQSQPPDFVGQCQKAAGAKAGVDPTSVKVRGKYKAQDGRIMVDFKLADGRVGVCRSQANAAVDEVKLEEPKAAAPN
jgi:hypothetical protein